MLNFARAHFAQYYFQCDFVGLTFYHSDEKMIINRTKGILEPGS